MISIQEYLLNKNKKTIGTIKATNETIANIVYDEIAKKGIECDLNHIDTSAVTNMEELFLAWPSQGGHEHYQLVNPDISEWDVSNVTSMRGMFCGCHKFNCDISRWDVRKVKDFNSMFIECYEFDQPIGSWKIDSMEDAVCMFKDCKSFSQDLSSWNNKFIRTIVSTSRKWDMHKLAGMFAGTKMERDREIDFYPSEALYNLLNKYDD